MFDKEKSNLVYRIRCDIWFIHLWIYGFVALYDSHNIHCAKIAASDFITLYIYLVVVTMISYFDIVDKFLRRAQYFLCRQKMFMIKYSLCNQNRTKAAHFSIFTPQKPVSVFFPYVLWNQPTQCQFLFPHISLYYGIHRDVSIQLYSGSHVAFSSTSSHNSLFNNSNRIAFPSHIWIT